MADDIITAYEKITAASEIDRLAYTKKRYLSPKEIAAYVLVNFGQKNLSQYVSVYKEFFMIQFLKLNSTAYAHINLFASIYDALDDTLSGLIIDRTRTRWGRIRPFFILPLPLWVMGGFMMFTAPEFSSVQKVIWSATAILIYGLGMSYFNAWNLMMYNITPNTDERNNLITTTKFFELFGDWIPSFVPIFVEILPRISSKFTMQGIYSFFAYFILILAVIIFSLFSAYNYRICNIFPVSTDNFGNIAFLNEYLIDKVLFLCAADTICSGFIEPKYTLEKLCIS